MSSLRLYLLLLACMVSNAVLVAQVPVAPSDPATDVDKNWIITRIFKPASSFLIENPIINESKDFLDSKGLTIQRQYKVFNANNTAQGSNRTHVMAYEILYDAQGRPALTTLPAPINNQSFKYSPNFSGGYSCKDFDEDKTNAPTPVPNLGVGTLGWFYSTSNTWEPYRSATGYPYTRAAFYKDGTGAVKKVAGVGETFKMGSNHEASNYTTPVLSELDHYCQVRNKFWPNYELGNLVSNLSRQAVQTIAKDENGNLNITIQDMDDNKIMIARPGNDLIVNNVANMSGYEYTYTIPSGGTFMRASGAGTLKVIGGSVSTSNITYYNGPTNGYNNTTPVPSSNPFILSSDKPFKVWYSFYYPSESVFKSECEGCHSESTLQPGFHYFYLFNTSNTIQISGEGGYILTDMNTEQPVPGISGFGSFNLPAGYYKITSLGPWATLNYSNGYSDISYNIYNHLFQLVATVEPQGVLNMLNGGINNYATQVQMPFTTFNLLDVRGRLVESRDCDAGVAKYIYAEDGNLRFSQNAEQYGRAAYTYITYDRWGRTIESGEFFPTGGGISFNSAQMLSIVNLTDQAGNNFGSGIRNNWTKFKYDTRDDTHGLPGYSQNDNYLDGKLTYCEGPDSKRWISYDIQGTVAWEIKWVNGLGYKTFDYTRDVMDNLTKLVYQKNVPAETFVHYYEYDYDYNLKEVYVNTTDNPGTRQLQAKYYYNLTGEDRRMELGTNVQGIDLTYTAQGTLKAINNSDKTKDPGLDGTNGFLPDAFGMSIDYYDNDYNRSGTFINSLNGLSSSGVPSLYDGNIRAVTWFSKKTPGGGTDAPATYGYIYDKDGQMLDSKWGNPSFATQGFTELPNVNKETVAYSPNGNITSLVRKNNAGGILDNFTYSYVNNTNRLASIPSYVSFDYTPVGEVKRISRAGVPDMYLKYTSSGSAEGVYNDASYTSAKIKYLYDETGERIAKTDLVTNTTTYYVYESGTGDLMAVYTKTGAAAAVIKEQPIYGQQRIGTFNRTGTSTGDYRYEMMDHLGNVRVVISNANVGGQPDVVQFNDFYPYGYRLSAGGSGYRFGYQGQFSEDEVNETGLNVFDLRSLDTRIGRWMSVDPANEFSSPYVAMGNNPAYFTDPSGGAVDDCPGCPDPLSYPHYTKVESPIDGHDYIAFHFNNGTAEWRQVIYNARILEGVSVSAARATGLRRVLNWFKNDCPIISSAVSAYNAFADGNILAGLGHTFMAVSDLFLIKAAGTYLVKQGIKFTVKQTLKYMVKKAVKNPAVLSQAQKNAAARFPNLAKAYRGTAIEKSFRAQAGKNPVFKFMQKRGWVNLGKTNKGPDLIGGGPLKGKWMDITTKADWGKHVAKYQGANATKGVDWGTGLNWALY